MFYRCKMREQRVEMCGLPSVRHYLRVNVNCGELFGRHTQKLFFNLVQHAVKVSKTLCKQEYSCFVCKICFHLNWGRNIFFRIRITKNIQKSLIIF